MAKTKASRIKKELNGIIMKALEKRKMPYVNMEQAVHDMAIVLNLDVSGFSVMDARRIVASGITGRIMPDVEQIRKSEKIKRQEDKEKRRATWAAQNPDRNYQLGIPSASTLDRDIKAFYASWEWKRLSFDVKLERGRKCECCGAKAPDVRINTDHIKPIRHHWHLRLDKANLQILCEDCNMGKGSRDESDFRALNALDDAPREPELTDDEAQRLQSIRDQLRLN